MKETITEIVVTLGLVIILSGAVFTVVACIAKLGQNTTKIPNSAIGHSMETCKNNGGLKYVQLNKFKCNNGGVFEYKEETK